MRHLKQTATICLTVLAGVLLFVFNTDIFFSRLLLLDHAYLSQFPIQPLGLATNLILLTLCGIGYIRATRKSESYELDNFLPFFLLIIIVLTCLVRIDEFKATLFKEETYPYKVITSVDWRNIIGAFLAQSTFIGLITHSIIKRIKTTKTI